ncbi:MAG: hypothetical protein AAF509_08845, partial [Pseudomonadota bacterium]
GAGVAVKQLSWHNFDGARGAKATAFEQAKYLITRWSTGRFELSLSYPGYSTGCDKTPHLDSLDEAKAAAQVHYEKRIRSALSPAPVSVAEAAHWTPEQMLDACEAWMEAKQGMHEKVSENVADVRAALRALAGEDG